MVKIDYKLVIAQTRQLTLLYVEDDDTLREETANFFRKFFALVDVASNGQEGLDQYKRYYEKTNDYYDVVITDINMPVMNGIAMASEMRHILWNQIIVMISAYSEEEYYITLLEMGVDGFVLKPTEHQKLLDVLYKAGKKAQDRRMGMAYCTGNESLIVELERANATIKADKIRLEANLRELQQKSHTIDVKHEQISTLMQSRNIAEPVVAPAVAPTPVKSPSENNEEFYLSQEHCSDLIDLINEIPELIEHYGKNDGVVHKIEENVSSISSIMFYYSPYLDALATSFHELSEAITRDEEHFSELLSKDKDKLLILFDAVIHDLVDYIARFGSESLEMDSIHQIHLPTALSIQQIIATISPGNTDTGDMEFF